MALLREIALYYTENDANRLFWDYFAMYDLWKTVGSGAHDSVANEKRRENIDYLYGEVQDRFVNKILTNFVRKTNYKIKEGDTNDVARPLGEAVKRLLKGLLHAKKVKDRAGMHENLVNIMKLFSEGHIQSILPDLDPSDVKSQYRISTGNPARYIGRVSSTVEKQIRANLQSFIGYDKVAGEKGKEEKVVSAPRGEYTPEEKELLMKIGLNIIAVGNAAKSTANGGPRINLDKLQDGTYIFFDNDKSVIEIFDDFRRAVNYVEINWGKAISKVWGRDLTIPEPVTPPPPPPAKPIVQPAGPALAQPMVGSQPKRLSPNWEAVLTKYGYSWEEGVKSYAHTGGDYMIWVFPDNSGKIFQKNGKETEFKNLGILFRLLTQLHGQPAQQGMAQDEPAPQPAAGINEAHYKLLYNFLYA